MTTSLEPPAIDSSTPVREPPRLPGPGPRAWLLNPDANPYFTFHLKHDAVTELQAVTRISFVETD